MGYILVTLVDLANGFLFSSASYTRNTQRMKKLVTLPLDRVRLFNFVNQRLTSGYQSSSISETVTQLVGLHAARLATPYTSLQSRVIGFSSDKLFDRLNVHKDFIKLRCMRKTLHIVPVELAPMVHRATLKQRLKDIDRLYRAYQLSGSQILNLREYIASLLLERDRTPAEIVNIVSRCSYIKDFTHNERTIIIRAALKHLWEDGVACYINKSRRINGEQRFYGATSEHFPDLQLQDIDEFVAQVDLVQYYIQKFGPVTFEDIAWWTGIRKTVIRNVIKNLSKKLQQVNVSSFSHTFYMLDTELERFHSDETPNDSWIALASYEDPSLKGYYQSRYRYVDDRYYHLLFNKIGEVRASILIDGIAAGVWRWNSHEKRMEWYSFYEITQRARTLIEELLSDMGKLFGNREK